MFCQLGTTVFDGLKSFTSFSQDEEAVVVEHALINRKPKLQGTAVGLKILSITLFLHQEFCIVADEITKLRNSMISFEILPLLWGNGQLEGEFVITSMSRQNTQMDTVGNLVSAGISLTLKESAVDDKLTQQQQAAQTNAFAVGNKKPATKSTRVNPVSCSKQVSNIMTLIKSNAAKVDSYSRQYSNNPVINGQMQSALNIIITNAQKLVDASATQSSCAYGVTGFGTNAANVKVQAGNVLSMVQYNIQGYINPLFVPNISSVKSRNDDLQAAVKTLTASANSIINSSITRK
jgi:phage protein U